MTKAYYMPITPELIHQVATLSAAGLRINAIALRTGVSHYFVRRIMLEAAWQATLDSKRTLFAQMMKGEQ